MMGRALRITEKGLKRAIEILKASKPGAGRRLRWSGKTLTSEILRAEIDSTILHAGGFRPVQLSPVATRHAIRMSGGTGRFTQIH